MSPEDLTSDVLAGYFGEHCECRPLDVDRVSHSHDCDDGPCGDVRVALGGRSTDARVARRRIYDDIFREGDGLGRIERLAELGRRLIGDAVRLDAGR